jgi:hypothetical protein
MLKVAKMYGHKVKPVERPRMMRERRTRYLTREEAGRLLRVLDRLPSMASDP